MKRVLLLMALLLCVVFNGFAQTKIKLTGTVKDTKGEVMIGVQVVPVGAIQYGGLTDLDGNFSIMVPDNVKQLSFSYIGYAKQVVDIAGKKQFIITLAEESSALDEVVVVGYTTQKRTRMTTSVSKLDNKVLASTSRSNAATALQGTIPGLRVTQVSGQPGETPKMVLRGGLAFDKEGSEPLILIDGVPSSFYGLNSDDIETVEVLKDAASTAIYGARAANGVILVTTKKGKSGHSSINFRSKFSFNSRPQDPMNYLGAADYVRMNRLGIANTHKILGNERFNSYLSGNHGAATGNTDINSIYTTQFLTEENKHLLNAPGWEKIQDPLDPTKTLIFQSNSMSDLIYQNSHAEDYSLSFDGGNDKGSYYLGLGMLNDRGLVLNSGFKRYSATFNGSYKVTPKLKVSSSMMYLYSSKDLPVESISELFQRAQGMAPTTRLFYMNADGTNTDRPFPGTYLGFGNPRYYANTKDKTNLEQRFSGNAQLEYKITDKLTAKVQGSHLLINNDDEVFTRAFENGVNKLETTRKSEYQRKRYTTNQFTALLSYHDTFKDKHNLSALAGWEYLYNESFEVKAATELSPTDLIATMNAGARASGSPYSYKTEYAIASLLGQVNYDYDMRYLVGFTFRYDGSTRLLQDKWGFFPGVSLGWNIHNEGFFKNAKIKNYINSLKPRISYGVNGNIDALGNYTVQGLYKPTEAYNGEKGYINTELVNPTLRWERSTTLNFGLDLGLFNNRVTLMADYFVRNVQEKITDLTLPIWTGFSKIATNNGTLQNRGLELQLNADIIRTKDFSWNLSVNYTSVRSYAVALPDNGLDKNRQGGYEIYNPETKANEYVGGIQEGERLGWDLIVGYVHDGVYRTQEELDAHKGRIVEFATNKKTQFLGDTRWKDLNGDNVINSYDRVVLGRTTPTFTGGLNTTLSYKAFSLYAKTDFAVGHKLYHGRRIKGIAQTQGNQNGPVEILDSWSPENPNGTLARYDFTDQQKNHRAAGNDQGSIDNSSSYFLERGDYLALRELTLSYNFNKPLFGGQIKGFRLYATGANLFYFTSYGGTTPEVAVNGVDDGRYPVPRTFTFGLNLTF